MENDPATSVVDRYQGNRFVSRDEPVPKGSREPTSWGRLSTIAPRCAQGHRNAICSPRYLFGSAGSTAAWRADSRRPAC